MKRLNIKNVFLPVLSLLLIAVITCALLAITNRVTAENIEKSALKKAEDSRRLLFSDAVKFEPIDDYFLAVGKDDTPLGLTFNVKSKGYGGDIEAMVGITLDDKISGVIILSNSETPGLGANCVKESFTGEYIQELENGEFYVVKDKTGGSNAKIDAITGATITSNAVTKAVNEAVAKYNKVKEGIR